MRVFHGRLLIGGMSVNDIDVAVHTDNQDIESRWVGNAEVDPQLAHALETDRQYRLETDDGCAAQLVVRQMHVDPESESLVLELEGLTPLR